MKILLLAALAAFCDVTIQSESSSTGYRGFGASETKSVRSISGQKAREEGNARFTGAVLGAFGKKGKDAVSVIRVDKGVIWQIDDKKKSYAESPIKPPEMEKGESRETSPSGASEEKPTHRIKSAEAEVKDTGEKKKINGFATNRWSAMLTVVVEDLKTKETAQYTMKSDVWATPWSKELKQAVDEENKFNRAYLKKLGLDVSPDDQERFGMRTAAMLLAAAGPELEKAMTKLTKGMSKIDGYAIVTETEWQTPAMPAAAKGKKAEDDEDEDSSLSDAAGAGSLGGAAMGFMGGLAKKAAKKKAKEMAAPKPGKAAFSVRTEIKKVDVEAVAESDFEIPANYKKKG